MNFNGILRNISPLPMPIKNSIAKGFHSTIRLNENQKKGRKFHLIEKLNNQTLAKNLRNYRIISNFNNSKYVQLAEQYNDISPSWLSLSRNATSSSPTPLKSTPSTSPSPTSTSASPSASAVATVTPLTQTLMPMSSSVVKSNSSDIDYNSKKCDSSDSSDSSDSDGECRNQPFRQCNDPRNNNNTGLFDVEKDMVQLEYVHGFPQLTLPLPSRNETCQFSLMPNNHRVGDVIDMIKEEDPGIDRVLVLNKTGVRIGSSAHVENLLNEPFFLMVNNRKYYVKPPKRTKKTTGTLDNSAEIADVRAVVAQMYESLNLPEYIAKKEFDLVKRLEQLKFEIMPMENTLKTLDRRAKRRLQYVKWGGLFVLAVNCGILARLTWWDYSWDIMEPVSYFVQYFATMLLYGFFCVSGNEFNNETMIKRQYLFSIYKNSSSHKFDIELYNQKKREIAEIEYDLRRLRDPLYKQISANIYQKLLNETVPPNETKKCLPKQPKSPPSGPVATIRRFFKS